MKVEELIEGNILISEFMGFVKHYPNMEKTSDLALHYQYPYADNVFDESLYVTDMHMSCAEGTFRCSDITRSKHILEYRFHNSITWIFPVILKIFSLPVEDKNGMILYLADVELSWHRKDINQMWTSVVKFIKWYNDK